VPRVDAFKAVNPNRKINVDTRTPAEILDR
jgi:hypothetical protein